MIGAGAERARARLALELAATKERLKDAEPQPITRQRARYLARRGPKMPIGFRQAEWHALRGFPTIRPGRRRSA